MKLKSLMIISTFLFIMVLISQAAYSGDYCGECYNDECRSPGYWKNHPDAWPVNTITIGDITYTKEEAIYLMNQPVKGNKWYTMFKALVAAKLNRSIGCVCCDANYCIGQASNWMAFVHEPPYSDIVRASSTAWQCGGEDLYLCLDDFNNGELCE